MDKHLTTNYPKYIFQIKHQVTTQETHSITMYNVPKISVNSGFIKIHVYQQLSMNGIPCIWKSK
jgi:hypothetical protein